MTSFDPPDRCSVVVVGAGLSGLVAATELRRAGLEDLVVFDARDRVGGRLHSIIRPGGRELMAGGEFVGPASASLLELAASLGIDAEPLPGSTDPETAGRFVRLDGDTRVVEDYPFAGTPDTFEAYLAACALLDELARKVPTDAPWLAPDAAEWDHTTIGRWLQENVPDAGARSLLGLDFAHFGDLHTVSLLYGLWSIARFGGWERAHDLGQRLVGGTAQLPRRLAADLGGAVVTSCPVRRLDHTDDEVVVHHDRGTTRCRAVIVAMEPGQAGKIEFVPPLSAARDYLQSRWAAGHGAKFFAVYDTPFWREEGLSGTAMGPAPFGLVMDVSPTEADEGILLALYFGGGPSAVALSQSLAPGDGGRAAAVEAFAAYFGEQARHPKEFHSFDWSGDRWASGCGSQVPPGVLSTVGPTLNPPVGRLVWAGSENGAMDWLEGAVTSGRTAAQTVAAILGK